MLKTWLITTVSISGLAAGFAVAGDDAGMTPASPSLIVLIGGFDSDPSPEQIAGTAPRGRGNSGMFQLMNDLKQDEFQAEYFNWNGTRAGSIQSPEPPGATSIATFLRERRAMAMECRIVIVGNSWGGHTAWEVCRSLNDEPRIPVELLVLLDPSSAGRGEAPQSGQLPANVSRAFNYHTRNLFVWRNWTSGERLTTIDLGDPEQGFMSTPQRAYDATFNWPAHVAAEWDEKIHRDIRRRIVEALRR